MSDEYCEWKPLFKEYLKKIDNLHDDNLKKIYCINFFLNNIENIVQVLISHNDLGKDIKSEITIRSSMIYSFIIFTYSILEIVDDKFLKERNHPIYIVRSKLAHGSKAGLINYAPWKNAKDLEGKKFVALTETGVYEKKIWIKLFWQVNNNEYYIDSIKYETNVEASNKLLDLLNKNPPALVCKSGNFACYIDELYQEICTKTKLYCDSKLNIS
ncbi:MAG: hypothetical protein ABIJ18_03295 [archaeon]